jgi:hypothetical protein
MNIEWRGISSAPRDGTTVIVGAPDDEWFTMRWNPRGRNSIFQPEPVGIWEAPDGSFTWSEEGGFGPSHWRPALTKGEMQ